MRIINAREMYDIIHMMIEYEFEYTFIIQGR